MRQEMYRTPDLAARWVLMLAHLYYDRNVNLVADQEYDALSNFVADHWDEVHPFRQWQLGDAHSIRSSGCHVKLTRLSIAAAERVWSERRRERLCGYQFEEAGQHPENRCSYTTIKG